MSEKIMLIDGNSLINRAFYALPPLTNKEGLITNAVYGFLNIFLKFFDEEKPDKIVVAFDLKEPTFRHEMYKEYKGNRKSMPDDLRPQIPLLKEVLEKMNIPICSIAGYEADDILGTLAKKAENQGLEAVIISGDRDLLQIASEKITIRIPKTKAGQTVVESYKAKDVIDLYGVTPIEYIDVKALMGDASDNIPGVPSIGEKTALKIIQEYKNIETAIENAENIKPKKASENIVEFSEQAILSRVLATISIDSPVELPENKITSSEIFNKEAHDIIKRLEFKSHYARFSLTDEPVAKKEEQTGNYILLNSLEKCEEYIKGLEKEEIIATSLVNFGEEICGLSFFSNKSTSGFLPFNANVKIPLVVENLLKSDVKKVCLDSKKDKLFMKKSGLELNNVVFDTSVGAYVLNASSEHYFYDDIAREFLNKEYPSVSELTGKGKGKLDFLGLSEKEQLSYACRQSEVAFDVYELMLKKIEENKQDKLYFDIEFPLVDVLCDMEFYGIKINKNELLVYDSKLQKSIDILTSNIYELASEEFNINSPKQLGVILFEKLGLKGGKKTKTGYSTAAEVLEKLKSSHPIISEILNYRTLAKLKSTYCDGLLNVMDEKTHKIHSTFNQTVTTTGRISSTEPNLQNIPIRMDLGRELRKIFIPSEDNFVFADGDYSQIELRVLAHISGDETMIRAFKNGEDIHRITASQVLNITPLEVTEKQRSSAKAINFGIVYGISAFSLSEDLSITRKEAEDYINSYLERYPKVKEYMDNAVLKAKEKGYAETIFGRRRTIDELKSANFNIRSFGERVAMNMPIQGSAADIIKIAMVKVYNRLKTENLKSRIILQVHDELLLEVDKGEVDKVTRLVKQEMEAAVNLLVPMEVDIKTGATWYDTK